MIGILDYGMGNLRSVQKAFERLGGTAAIIVTDPGDVVGCEKLILPGVGNFADGMDQLRQRGFEQPVRDFIGTGRPLLGICMGMQLLLDSSTEDASRPEEPVPGLSIVPGIVERFDEDQGDGQPRLKVPHMGWNRLEVDQSVSRPLLAGLGDDPYVYFVHSYYCTPSDPSVVAATTGYGSDFCSVLHAENVWATQFHPEKSQQIGLKILHNFSAM